MTKKEAIKWLENLKEDIGRPRYPRYEALWHYEQALDEIIQTLTQKSKTGEWIPVSERLPREDGQYLVYYEGTIIGSCIEIMWYSEPSMPNVDVSGKHFYRSDSEWGDIIYDEVIAWMPLPKPYRKDSK